MGYVTTLHDSDRVYGAVVRAGVKVMGIEEGVTAPRPPWRNRFVERAIGPLSGGGLEWRLSLRASRPRQRPDGVFRNDTDPASTTWRLQPYRPFPPSVSGLT